MVKQVIATVEKDYPEKTGLQASVFVCSAEEGASLISVK
jgi:galactokinase